MSTMPDVYQIELGYKLHDEAQEYASRASVELTDLVRMAVRQFLDRSAPSGGDSPTGAGAGGVVPVPTQAGAAVTPPASAPLFKVFPEGLEDPDPIRVEKDGTRFPGGVYSAFEHKRVPAHRWKPIEHIITDTKKLPEKWRRNGVPTEHVEWVQRAFGSAVAA